jgi:hypothetical protein
MRVISTTGVRTISVILRDYSLNDTYNVIIENESTKETFTISVIKTVQEIQSNNDLFLFDIDNDFLESTELSFYIIQPLTTKILHRNKIFVTDKQTQNWNE